MRRTKRLDPLHKGMAAVAVAAMLLAALAAGVPAQARTPLAVEANVNVAVNVNSPIAEVAAQAEATAKSAGLRDAIGKLWKLVWEESWPFIKNMVLKFFGLFGKLFASIKVTTETNANVPANVNGGASANVNGGQ